MKTAKKIPPAPNRDPWPYDGPIERADGRRPFNRYLWPTEYWSANQTRACRRLDGDWRIEIIALKGGQWATDGCVWEIERNDKHGWRVLYDTRKACLRTAAARLIRDARTAAKIIRDGTATWSYQLGSLQGTEPALIIAWARQLVTEQTGGRWLRNRERARHVAARRLHARTIAFINPPLPPLLEREGI